MLATPLQVRVSAGALAGLEGVVATVTSDGLVTVAITSLPGVFFRISMRSLSVVQVTSRSSPA